MAKNKKYKKQFLIEVEGVTTNDFMSGLIVQILNAVMESLNSFAQTSASIKEITDDKPA